MDIRIEKMIEKNRKFIDCTKDPIKFLQQNIASTIIDRNGNIYIVCEDYCLITFTDGIECEIDYKNLFIEKMRSVDISVNDILRDWKTDIKTVDRLYDKHRLNKLFI